MIYVLGYTDRRTTMAIASGLLVRSVKCALQQHVSFQVGFIGAFMMLFGNQMLLTSLFISSLVTTMVLLESTCRFLVDSAVHCCRRTSARLPQVTITHYSRPSSVIRRRHIGHSHWYTTGARVRRRRKCKTTRN